MPREIELFPALRQLDNEPAQAYAAFIDYMRLPQPRLINKLAEWYKSQIPANAGKKGQKGAFTANALYKFSSDFLWKQREGAYIAELALDMQTEAAEFMAKRSRKLMRHAQRIDKEFETLLDKYTAARITSRQIVDDPRNPGQSMEIITMRVNSREMRDLTAAFGQLNKDLQAIFGTAPAQKVSVSWEQEAEKMGIPPSLLFEQMVQATMAAARDGIKTSKTAGDEE